MKTQKIYYHILEYGNYDNIGWKGYFSTIDEAKKEADKLSDYFPNSSFQIEISTSKKEPVNTTI